MSKAIELIKLVEEEKLKLARVCSWCGKILDVGDPGAETTHTICPECMEKNFKVDDIVKAWKDKGERPNE